MGENTPENWYYREAGVVSQVAHDVVDPAPMHRANAYRKAALGEELTDVEREAVVASAGRPLLGESFSGGSGTLLGFMYLQAPELVQRLDDLMTEWAARLGGFELFAWQTAAEYVERAQSAVAYEAGLGSEEAQLDRLARLGETPERITEIQASWAESKEFSDAWSASPEGIEAMAEATTPDGGPDGWSTVPGRDPAAGLERSKAFTRRYRAERGLAPLANMEPASGPKGGGKR